MWCPGQDFGTDVKKDVKNLRQSEKLELINDVIDRLIMVQIMY